MTRLSSTVPPRSTVLRPGYNPEAHGAGIVHIGVGAFHKAHQAAYTDTALAAEGGDWRIIGVSLRSAEAASALNPQDGRYVLITRDEAGDIVRVIGSIERVLVASDDPEAVIEAIASPAVKIVTITVTEKGYGIDRASGGLDLTHPAIAHDLGNPGSPIGVIGFLVAGLSRRKARGEDGLTVLSCDNLPSNGRILARLVDAFAREHESTLANWIERKVRFPSCMVDRITPSATKRTFTDATRLSGCADKAAVETEPFSQWVIEDVFAAGRPAWEASGAMFVEDVIPYEQMKLRLLNGTHSLLAYAGFLAGHETVSDAIGDPHLNRIAVKQMEAAAATLPPLDGVDLADYRWRLLDRFANRAIRHFTRQIAMDGTQKLPQRILAPLDETARRGGDIEAFCFAIAAWMRYCLGVTDEGVVYALNDPAESVIRGRLAATGLDARAIFEALSTIPNLFGPAVAANDTVRDCVVMLLASMLEDGMATAARRWSVTF